LVLIFNDNLSYLLNLVFLYYAKDEDN